MSWAAYCGCRRRFLFALMCERLVRVDVVPRLLFQVQVVLVRYDSGVAWRGKYETQEGQHRTWPGTNIDSTSEAVCLDCQPLRRCVRDAKPSRSCWYNGVKIRK